jgi:hypothetical protein
MKLFAQIFLAFSIFMPTIIFSADLSLVGLPKPCLLVTMDIEPILSLRENKEYIRGERTGLSPGRTGKRSVCLDTPKKNAVGISVSAVQAGHKPPLKKCKLNFEETSEVLSIRPCQIIYSADTSFKTGLWAYADPTAANSSAAIDSDDPGWNSIIEELLIEINPQNQENFIASIIQYIKNNRNALKKMLIYQAGDALECRHFATLALPIFAKLLNHPDVPFLGSIQQISADVIDQKWAHADVGHVWNLLTLSDGVQKTEWFLDVYRNRIINLSETPYLSKLKLQKLNGEGFFEEETMTKKSDFYDYARLTKEKFNICPRNKNNLSKNNGAQRLGAAKQLLQGSLPQASCTIQTN